MDTNVAPEEEKESPLPKTCYLNDGQRKVDFVIVFPKLEERIRGDRTQVQINQFIAQIKDKGLVTEREVGKFHTSLVFLKIHCPHKHLIRYANLYNLTLTCQNPYYKYKEPFFFKCLTTEVTTPESDSDVYKRAEKTLSGKRPTEITTAERSKIVYEVLKRISFIVNDDEFTLKIMLDKEFFLQAYPIHDGDYAWSTDGPLTDRQLLFEYWANLKYIFKEQPIQLIQKYYGPKIGFYFALMNLYTKMLVVPAVIGTMTVLAGLTLLAVENIYLEDEVCKSNIFLCSDQFLKTACDLSKLAYLIDNPFTIVYVVLCSFWGAIFWNLWQRRQAMLRLRWNLTSVKVDRTMRQEFKENAKTRKSSITGEIEYYIPASKKVLSAVFSYVVVLVMILIFSIIVFILVEYRFFLNSQLDYDEVEHANEIELFTASILTTIIIMIINGFAPLILKMYSKIIRFLTMLRMPRTQSQYDRIYLHMTFTLTFANYFSPLFYLAYVKGFFHTYPGDVSDIGFISRIQYDLCKPSGCLVDLGMQLITIMVISSASKCISDFVEFISAPWRKFAIPEREKQYGQWEKDFAIHESDDSTINELYSELVLQFSFITFFNASLPLIGVIALIHNLLRIQQNAYRFLKLYRRPVAEVVPDIGGWNQVLKIVTVIGCISNSFIVAFRTNFIQRFLYKRKYGSLEGYVNSTLSKFLMDDFKDDDIIKDHKNETYCFYRGLRHPPEHPKKYQPTIEFWHHLAVRSLYFIILENFTLLFSLALGYLIPEIPRKVKVKIEHDDKLLKAAREAQSQEQNN